MRGHNNIVTKVLDVELQISTNILFHQIKKLRSYELQKQVKFF